jgi:BMFP domain-containing protein YqiC
MSEPHSAQEFIQQVFRLLPEDLRTARADLEKHLRAAMSAAFARMDLVTREEFDVQAALLSRTRALLDEMEAKVAELERRVDRGKRTGD